MTRIQAVQISQVGFFIWIIIAMTAALITNKTLVFIAISGIGIGWLLIWDGISDHYKPDFPTPKYTFEEKVLRRLGL